MQRIAQGHIDVACRLVKSSGSIACIEIILGILHFESGRNLRCPRSENRRIAYLERHLRKARRFVPLLFGEKIARSCGEVGIEAGQQGGIVPRHPCTRIFVGLQCTLRAVCAKCIGKHLVLRGEIGRCIGVSAQIELLILRVVEFFCRRRAQFVVLCIGRVGCVGRHFLNQLHGIGRTLVVQRRFHLFERICPPLAGDTQQPDEANSR